jgi:hypothetical protein
MPTDIVKRVYLPVALLMTMIAIVGFWRTYFGPLLSGTLDKVPVIHLHAVVFMGWLALLTTQAFLAGTGRIDLHRMVGAFGMAYGVIIILVGWLAALNQFATFVEAGQLEVAQSRLVAPLTDLLFFAPFLLAAWLYRDRPEVHKRLIIVATTTLLIAAVHRLAIFGGPPPPTPLIFAVWLAPIGLAMTYDFLTRKLVHPVYLLGIAAVVVMKYGRAWILKTDTWQDFTTWLAEVVA